MPFPVTVNGQRAASSGGNYAYAINNKSSFDNQIASMLYVKWLLEESPIYEDEGSIPALKGEPLLDSLAEFEGVELLSDNPPMAGEESLYDDIRMEAEVLSGDYPPSEVLEAALYGTKELDDLMNEWNEQWTKAQESFGVEVTEDGVTSAFSGADATDGADAGADATDGADAGADATDGADTAADSGDSNGDDAAE